MILHISTLQKLAIVNASEIKKLPKLLLSRIKTG